MQKDTETSQKSIDLALAPSMIPPIPSGHAGLAPVAESVDAADSKSVVRKDVPVRVWPGAPKTYGVGHHEVGVPRLFMIARPVAAATRSDDFQPDDGSRPIILDVLKAVSVARRPRGRACPASEGGLDWGTSPA